MRAVKNSSSEDGVTREVSIPYEPGTMDIAEEIHERRNMLTDFSKRWVRKMGVCRFPKTIHDTEFAHKFYQTYKYTYLLL